LPINARSRQLECQLGGSAVTDAPAILIDCDGVLVDNLEFERQVTSIIVECYARHVGLSPTEAEIRWSQELAATRGDSQWYDYSFHASRLGLDGADIAIKAHYAARDLLKLVRGADKTLALLQEYGLQVCVVTDATRWVVEYKLAALGIGSMLSIFSSTDASATKAKEEYWTRLAEQYKSFSPRVFIDNRQVNLATAHHLIGQPRLVQFDKSEHVMTLSTTEAPISEIYGGGDIYVVRNHKELRAWIKANVL
jgi:phosphoglycolate phosphatase-like HAD superfamily hydrolase